MQTQTTTHEYKGSLKLLQTLLDASEDAIVCTGDQNTITWMNQKAQSLLGVPGLDSSKELWHHFIASESKEDYQKHLNALSSHAGSRKIKAAPFEFMGVNRKRRLFHARVQLKKIKHENSWLTVHFIQELSPQKPNLSLSLQSSKKHLTYNELQDFSYILSHESNDPLRKIVSFSERLDSGYREKLGERGQKYLGCMGKAVKKFQRLVDDLRDFSRISTKPGEITRVPLNEIIKDLVSDFHTALAQSGGTIVAKELPEIEADPRQMRMLFKQLISNSLKFRETSRSPSIRIESREKEPHLWEIVVRDNGIGFCDEHAERIFGPCERLHGNDKYHGTGMGLAICRKIASQHNGTITGKGNPSKGATFTLLLPEKKQKPQTLATLDGFPHRMS